MSQNQNKNAQANSDAPRSQFSYETRLAELVCNWVTPDESLEDNNEKNWLYWSVISVSVALQQGHTCLKLSDWAGKQALSDWGIDFTLPEFELWHQYLSGLGLSESDQAPIVYENERLYLRRYWQFECCLAESLSARINQPEQPIDPAAEKVFNLLFPEQDKDAEIDWQRVAAKNALLNPFSVIAGGPGTGKTFTVTRILACLVAQNAVLTRDALNDKKPLIIKMVAPTGKAAQRLTESIQGAKKSLQTKLDDSLLNAIPEAATTIHRLLGVIPNSIQFRHNANKPLELDCLLVDEASMVDLPLMYRLLSAIPPQTKIILLGDADQLPSVAAGSVLADLTPRPHPGYSGERCQHLGISSAEFTAQNCKTNALNYLTYLKQSHRFDGKGGIGVLAKQIINGEVDASWQTLSNYPDQQLSLVSVNDRELQIQQWVDTQYKPVIQADNIERAWQLFSQFRILCATRVGEYGTEQLNHLITHLINPNLGVTYGYHSSKTMAPNFKGRPVMVTENNYGVGLFNGDIGLIWPDAESKQLFAWFPLAEGGFRQVPIARLPIHETVFAMTIHKTQGSEFDQVVMLLPDMVSPILSRELLYTGLTRAKNQFSYCGLKESWISAVTQRVVRHSGLAERLGINSES